MTTPELITDEIVNKALDALNDYAGLCTTIAPELIKIAILAIQDDITCPYRNLLQGYKHDAEAYERALMDIREQYEITSGREPCAAHNIADAALKGAYHKTDFTEHCNNSEDL